MEQLTMLGRKAKDHWEKMRPNMVATLKKEGIYETVLLETARLAENELVDLVVKKGVPHELALERVLHTRILFPSEKEMKHLPTSLMPYLTPYD